MQPMKIFGLLALASLPAAQAYAVSFQCEKAATTIEHAICGDKTLGALDDQVSESYRRLLESAPEASVSALRDGQRAWLKQRNQCSQVPANIRACLADTMSARSKSLDASQAAEDAALDKAIASIPDSPASAARTLRGYAGPLASAWLVYLNMYEPSAGVSPQEARQRRATAVAALASDPLAQGLYRDIDNKKLGPGGNATLTLLRMQIERADYDTSRPYVHCFVFARVGEPAYKAFGPLYGSSRDSSAPICAPQGGLFERAEWKTLATAIEPALYRGSENTGTIRFSYFASWHEIDLRATVSPRDYLKPSTENDKDIEQDIRNWPDAKTWPVAERAATLAAIEPARRSTADWLRTQRGFSSDDAAKAARGIVRAWLNGRAGFVIDMLSGE